MPTEPYAALGEFLTASEALALATRFEHGQHSLKALAAINPTRREAARCLLEAAELGHIEGSRSVAVLRAIAGAKSVLRDLTPVWTMPGYEANTGHLTSEFHRLVQAARISITCATYNFEKSSQMWTVLKDASEQPGMAVSVYIDGSKADAAAVKQQLPQANVFRSALLPNGARVVSHAKFVVIDHQLLLLTSANFSFSAENRNIEFGLLVHDTTLAASVELTMRSKHGSLYELI